MELLDGKWLSQEIKKDIATEVKKIIAQGGKQPHLAAVLVGDDPASQVYVRNKVKACELVGFKSTLIRREATISEQELMQIVHDLNQDDDVDGFIVQLPLPKHIDEIKVTLAIDPIKDVDGFHPMNVGRMTIGLPAYLPATPFGIMQMLERYKIDVAGKECVVLGRSNIVGTPISLLLSRKANPGNATVILCHSMTQNIKDLCRRADVLVVAMGRPKFVTEDMVKAGAVIIDVGINRIDDPTAAKGTRLVGDVDFEMVAPKCSYITPVPGGVGPMTITSLLMNTLRANRKEIYG
ncbi:MAG TPA: bifunctional methylenetetrahydrofolate dehydrogenase/methenyltetrahydrofolate cyclohydrolase FolD [Saprospiraceae bacterium]|nr:bifunctional methylenetetrahydrofolate dehydrogenase/methenyltetrahydrofolate cyclohydrolase FolD [Saprospiraceae bacterium]HPG08279.1 bifunctional methylenetetrahydrofolate dehydrogenase/methenyltetrahydrofolate cyclohydrolase FolD [Saprospiraceae bacterium]HRV86183.1 bifunctional methylenetetrahydrofolate dehydrogenase/methenyltetrahydrofolate cyclohydrolase FolD [Saprospiraceae bacterium]